MNHSNRASVFRCPRCGKGALFKGGITIVDECRECQLPLREHEQGDGPAFFGIVIIGTLASIFAAIIEVKYEPDYWVHAALWIPFIVIGSLLTLRYSKALLIHMQYQVKPWEFN
ncbi:MAG: DUF983 domain-containing protein [Rickettsiales bacterium]